MESGEGDKVEETEGIVRVELQWKGSTGGRGGN